MFNVWCHLSEPSSEKYYWSHIWPMHTLLPPDTCDLWKRHEKLKVTLSFSVIYQILSAAVVCLSYLSTFKALQPLFHKLYIFIRGQKLPCHNATDHSSQMPFPNLSILLTYVTLNTVLMIPPSESNKVKQVRDKGTITNYKCWHLQPTYSTYIFKLDIWIQSKPIHKIHTRCKKVFFASYLLRRVGGPKVLWMNCQRQTPHSTPDSFMISPQHSDDASLLKILLSLDVTVVNTWDAAMTAMYVCVWQGSRAELRAPMSMLSLYSDLGRRSVSSELTPRHLRKQKARLLYKLFFKLLATAWIVSSTTLLVSSPELLPHN